MRKAMAMNMKGPLPKLPETNEMTLVQGEVAVALREAIDSTIARIHHANPKKPKLKLRQVIEWGMSAWLLQNNPSAASGLGIKPKE